MSQKIPAGIGSERNIKWKLCQVIVCREKCVQTSAAGFRRRACGDKLRKDIIDRQRKSRFSFLAFGCCARSSRLVGWCWVGDKCGYEIRQTETEAIISAEMRKTGSLAAVILLITVGLAGKVFAFSHGKARGEVSAAQRYFDAVAPEGWYFECCNDNIRYIVL